MHCHRFKQSIGLQSGVLRDLARASSSHTIESSGKISTRISLFGPCVVVVVREREFPNEGFKLAPKSVLPRWIISMRLTTFPRMKRQRRGITVPGYPSIVHL